VIDFFNVKRCPDATGRGARAADSTDPTDCAARQAGSDPAQLVFG
jgi:hypothetical protein